MAKADRRQADRVHVVGFVHCHLLPDRRPNCLDPFLEPLLTELTDLFINGIEVDYPLTVERIPDGRATLRAILLAWTGDHPAQCEIANPFWQIHRFLTEDHFELGTSSKMRNCLADDVL